MNTTPDTNGLKAILVDVAHGFNQAMARKTHALTNLRVEVVDARTAGVLTVPQIAAAIGRERSAVDGIWATYGPGIEVDPHGKRKQTRVATMPLGTDDTLFAASVSKLSDAARAYKEAVDHVGAMRKERDRAIVAVYTSGAVGPSAIADLVGIDRNHVLRLVRKAGVGPIHRKNPRNQYTAIREEV
jgi:hypothetical protein